MSKDLTPNRPSPEGRVLGAQLARLTDKAEPVVRAQFPNHKDRCKSCAFTAGTLPNGCLSTVMDALKCVVDGTPFHCHQQFDEKGVPTDLCAGWALASTVADDRLRSLMKPIVADWELSCVYDETPRVEKPLTRCAAARDGECSHSQCPQLRDGEPAKSGRHCPIDIAGEEA